MKCSVHIATSVDGFIARKDGSVDWLQTAGNHEADMKDDADMGFKNYISSVDCMIMGRKCMDMISSMNLTPEQWPYGDLKIIVLSNSIKEAPKNLKDKVEIYSGNIETLISKLKNEDYKHAYIDGGTTIQNFLNLKLIDEITITKAPVLLGEGIPLFGKLSQEIELTNASSISYPNDFTQISYKVTYK